MTADSSSPTSGRLSRHAARRRAVEVLYEADVRRQRPEAALKRVVDDPHAAPLDAFSRELVSGVDRHGEAIDALIGSHARGWRLERMPVVDRNILRVAVYELVYGETPHAVVIDEAVKLAKNLGGDASPRYVNGVLSGVMRAQRDEGR